jgi:CheY-like chemotaxis protein
MAGARKVLVIDDEPTVLASVVELLELSGFDVVGAASGADGLASFRRRRADVVLTDLHMPGMDGLAVIAALRAIEPRATILVLSGAGDATTEARRLGAAGSIAKPILDLDALARAVEGAANGVLDPDGRL